MYSSSAYPTTIPSSVLVTTNRPAIDAPMGKRRQDTAAGFPVGLIPQLIDVLHILTEGQDLLSRKIRMARQDGSSNAVPIVEHLEHFQIPAGQPVVTGGSAGAETPSAPPSEDVEFGGETTPTRTLDIDCLSDPGMKIGGADTPPANVPESASPSDSPEVRSPDAMGDSSSASVVQPVPLRSVPPAETTTTSTLRRDYNFFDELDASLASLSDPAD
jgi:hypothetical protein